MYKQQLLSFLYGIFALSCLRQQSQIGNHELQLMTHSSSLSAIIHIDYVFSKLCSTARSIGSLARSLTVTLSTLLLAAKRHVMLKPRTTIHSGVVSLTAYHKQHLCERPSCLLRDPLLMANICLTCSREPPMILNIRPISCPNRSLTASVYICY